jgi:hypothetical protein
VEKGMQSYVTAPKEAKDRTIPTTPFSVTWNRERNALKSAYHAKSKIGWENLVKGRIAQEWVQFMETLKVIGALWEHTQRVWKFRDSIYHADQTGKIVRYKREEQQRRMDKIWARYLELQGRLRQHQLIHFDNREQKDNLRYDSQRCWASLAEMYLQEADSLPLAEQNELAQYLVARQGVG